jgi:small subunit ribosomal protein S6
MMKLRDINSLLLLQHFYVSHAAHAGGSQRPKGGNNSMNKYELAVVVSANVDDEAKTKAVDKCKALIERFGGTVTNVDDWGKKKLAYEIQKQTEGFYYFIQFDAEASVPAELESRVRIVDNVIRYLCVRNDEA